MQYNIRDDTLLTSSEERMSVMIKFIALNLSSHSAILQGMALTQFIGDFRLIRSHK